MWKLWCFNKANSHPAQEKASFRCFLYPTQSGCCRNSMVSHTIIVSTLTIVRPTVAARKNELESDSDAVEYLWVGIIHSVEEIWCLVIPSWLCAGAWMTSIKTWGTKINSDATLDTNYCRSHGSGPSSKAPNISPFQKENCLAFKISNSQRVEILIIENVWISIYVNHQRM